MKSKIQILLFVAMLNNALPIEAMIVMQRTKNVGPLYVARPLPPQPIKPIPVNMPAPQPQRGSLGRAAAEPQLKQSVAPLADKQADLLSAPRFSEAEDTVVGGRMRRWLRNLAASWFGPKVVSKPVENVSVKTSSPFGPDGQRRSYSMDSATVERQPLPVAQAIPLVEKSAAQKESDDIISKLNMGKRDDNVLEQISMFFKTESIDDIENLLMYLTRVHALSGLSLFGLQDLVKIESLKRRWFEKMGWFDGADIGDILFDQGRVVVELLPTNTDNFIAIVEKALQATLPVRVGHNPMNVFYYSERLKKQLMDSVVKRIMNEDDERKREKLCVLLVKNYERAPVNLAVLRESPDAIRALVSAFKKNMLDKDFVFNDRLAINVLSMSFLSNPISVEDLGSFIFQELLKKPVESYVGQIGESLVEIVRIFLVSGKVIPDGLLEFIVLNDKNALSHFNKMINGMSGEMQKSTMTSIGGALVSIIKKYKKVHLGSSEDVSMLTKFLEGSDFIEMILGIDRNLAQTPSYKHLQACISRLGKINFADIANNSQFVEMIQQVMYKEKELIDGGYEVFYHARRWQYGFLTDVYDMLYEYKSGKELKDFMFTQLDDPVLGKVSDKFYASETEKRERLIKEGNPFSYESKTNPFDIANRQALLFLNKFLFGNLNNLGSCSMQYVLSNHRMGEVDFSIEEVFNMFGLHDAYEQFEQGLKALQEEYNNLSKYGEMLQIAVPKDNVDKCVYYTTSGGPKKEFFSEGDGEKVQTTDIKTILKNLDQKPQDIAEFVLVDTRDKFGGLNPESGIKVFSHNAVEPAIRAAFKEKETALFGRIMDWMRHKNAQKEQAKMSRE